jgi:hypothetical protein
MKKWPGGTREFQVEVVGRDAAPQRVVFVGKRVTVKL